MAARGSVLPCAAAVLAALFALAAPACGQGRNGAYQEHYESVPPDAARHRDADRAGRADGDWAADGTFIGGAEGDREPASDDGEDVADASYFRAELNAGGKWTRHALYGHVWRPDVDTHWRPYTLGRWAYSNDYGWTWISDEPFGWAVYHYGRWGHDRETGWFWTPGTEWAPAWVAWREGEDVIGWAPLPPNARFVRGRMTFDTALLDREDYEPLWVFVRARHLVRPNLSRFLRPLPWNAELMVRSRPRVAYERASDRKWRRVINLGLSPQLVERLSNQPVPRLRIVPIDEPALKRADHFSGWRAREKREVKIYRPDRLRTERALSRQDRDAGEMPWRNNGEGEPPSLSRAGDTQPATPPAPSGRSEDPAPAPQDAGASPAQDTAAKASPSAEPFTYQRPPPATIAPGRDWTTTGARRSTGVYASPGVQPRESTAQSGDIPSGTIPVRPSRSKKRWDRSGPSGAPTLGGGEAESQD